MNQANPLPAELSAQLSALSPTQLAWLSGYCWAQSQGAAAPLPEVSAVRPAPAARRVTVLSASQTGNARRVAEQLHAGLKVKKGGTFRIKIPESMPVLEVLLNGKAVSCPIVDGMIVMDLHAADELAVNMRKDS